MGKLVADFIFGIHHRPGQVNADDEGLSRLPRDFHTYMDSFTEKLFPESLHASISALQTLSHGDLMWLTTLTDDNALSLASCNRVRVVNLIKAQKEDPHIGRVLDYSKQTANRQKRKRTKNQLWFCKLLNEWRKLHVHYRGTAVTKGKTPVPVC